MLAFVIAGAIIGFGLSVYLLGHLSVILIHWLLP